MGTGEGESVETKAHDLGSRQKENRGGAAGEVGEGEKGVELNPSANTHLGGCAYTATSRAPNQSALLMPSIREKMKQAS